MRDALHLNISPVFRNISRQISVRNVISWIVNWIIILVAFDAVLLSVNVSPASILKYDIYFIIYIVIPGLVYASILRIDVFDALESFALGAILGICAINIAYSGLLAMGRPELTYGYLLIPLGMGMTRLALSKGVPTRIGRPTDTLVFIVVCIFAVATMVSMFTGGSIRPLVDYHHVVQAVLGLGATKDWPIPLLTVEGATLKYNFVTHVEIAAAYFVTGLEIREIAARIMPVQHVMLLILMIFVLCRRWFQWGTLVALLAILQAFWFVRAFSWPMSEFPYLVQTLPAGLVKVYSRAFGVTFILFLVHLAAETMERRRGSAAGVIGWVAGGFFAVGARAIAGPIALCATGWMAFWDLVRRGRITSAWLIVVAMAAGVAGGLWFFFGVGSSLSSTGFVSVTGVPVEYLGADPRDTVANALRDFGLSAHTAGVVILALKLILLPGFLWLGLVYLGWERLRARRMPQVEVGLTGVIIASYAAYVLTVRTGGQDNSGFLYAGHVAVAMLAAAGVVGMLEATWQCLRRPTGKLLIRTMPVAGLLAVTAWLGAVHVSDGVLSVYERREDVVARSRRTQYWRGEKPDEVVEALRDVSDEDDVFILLVARESDVRLDAWARRVWILETGGLSYLGTPNRLRLYADFAEGDLKNLFSNRRKLVKKAHRSTRKGRLSQAPLVKVAKTLDESSTLYVVTSASLSAEDTSRLEEIARDGDTILYRVSKRE